MAKKIYFSEDEWKKKLTQKQYAVLREKATEVPFSGKYITTDDKGMYVCAGCGEKLFSSNAKFDSGCGWPSFFDAINGAVKFTDDSSYGMNRLEVTCKRCGGHLGHVFNDGPREHGGKRYCINSLALDFNKTPANGKNKK